MNLIFLAFWLFFSVKGDLYDQDASRLQLKVIRFVSINFP